MSEKPNEPENVNDYTQHDSRINNVVALTQLVGTIVDYYSFKNKLVEDEDDIDKIRRGNTDEDAPVIPEKIDSAIEKSFLAQMKKFIE
jgi:hypothetical protein